MQRIQSGIDPRSSDYKIYYEHNLALMNTLEERQAAVRSAGVKGNQRMIERGKLPARERVELLLDPNTPFLELSTLAAYDMYDDETPGAGVITGIGTISGVECLVSANN